MLDASSARKLDPLVQTKMTTQLGLDSSDSGLDLDVCGSCNSSQSSINECSQSYVEAKLVSETNGDDALIFLQRAVEDIFNHPCLARVVEKVVPPYSSVIFAVLYIEEIYHSASSRFATTMTSKGWDTYVGV